MYSLSFARRATHIFVPLLMLLLLTSELLPGLPATPVARAADPTFAVRQLFGSGADATRSVAVGDLDGDGDLDVVAGNGNRAFGDQNVVYLNDGAGTFYSGPITCGVTEPTRVRCFGPRMNDTWSVALGDVDGDGDLDIAAGNDSQQNLIYLNDGADPPSFTDVRPFGSGTEATRSIALGDVDGDGDLDLATGNLGQQNVVYLNDGVGTFYSGPITCGVTIGVRCFGNGTDETISLALGDLDGDGDIDLVSGNDAQQNVIYLNDGVGTFYSGPITCGVTVGVRCFGTGSDATYSVALGDVDSDGDLDLAESNWQQQNVVYLNDGAGNFLSGRDFGSGTDLTTSVALGDVDADGDLDLASGNNGQNVVYLNDGAGNFLSGRDFGSGTDFTWSVALGDVDADGALDLVVGNRGYPFGPPLDNGSQNVIYLNNGVGDFPARRFFGAGAIYSVAVGDVDGDGDLDLVTGSEGQSAVYFNDGVGNFHSGPVICGVTTNAHCFGPATGAALSVALGDLDGDGDLDLVVGNAAQPNVVYFNDGIGNFYSGPIACGATNSARVRCFGSDLVWTYSVALADVDGDRDIDIIAGNTSGILNSGAQSMVFLNDGASPPSFAAERPFGTSVDDTRSVAIGDLDGDGDLDLVTGNFQEQSATYFNDGLGNFLTRRSFGSGTDRTWSVAVGDVDGDGDLDIVAGNGDRFFGGQQNMVYFNDGTGNFPTRHDFGSGGDRTQTLALGDMDGDGDLDITAGNYNQQSVVYLNDGAGNFTSGRDFGTGAASVWSLALGDIDGDGDLDIITGSTHDQHAIDLNRRVGTAQLANNPPRVTINRPGGGADVNFSATPLILDQSTIPISYILADPESDPVRSIRVSFSFNGGGSWRTAVPINTTTTDLAASSGGTSHIFTWDTFRSGFFGKSDNVVIRIEAFPSVKPIRNGVPGPYQRPYASATSFPFRVRGTQVLVKRWHPPAASPPVGSRHVFLPLTLNLSVGTPAATPLANAPALVYRIRPGQVGTPLANSAGQPFPTDAQGFLQGRGEIDIGDQLVALQPIAYTKTYTAYLTSAAPTATGLDAFTVTASGVQTLTVAPDHPLVLFNLTVSLEWDARADPQFLTELSYNLQRVSELLYDLTDGQAALGHLTIYHAKGHWDDADIRLFASNRVRPNSNLGGIAEVGNQIRIGSVWNRFGDPSGNVGEDWPRALAHELGHYAFFLDDNYLGLRNGRITSISGCPGAMTDPYRDDYSELHPKDGWLDECANTLANQTTGRADWETVVGGYPWLHAPAKFDANPGPSTLPLAVTTLSFVAPEGSELPLAAPIINLVRAEDGARLVPSDRARAFLLRRTNGQDADLVDLGRPVLDQVDAHGARSGEQLCVYDLGAPAPRLGCSELTAATSRLALGVRPDWRPDVVIVPESARDITIAVPPSGVGNPLPARLQVRLFPTDLRQAPVSGALERQSDGWYRGTLTFAASQPPSLEGYVQVWVDGGSAPGRAIVTDYALGGNPAPPRRPPRRARRRAPAMSTDGQVILYGSDQDLASGEFYAIQTASVLPEPPAWATFVGQVYRLIGSPGAPPLSNVTLNVSYAASDVAPGTEKGVSVYYWGSGGWERLPTERDPEGGEVLAPARGAGLYVLMSSVEIPLKTGINLFAYSVPNRSVKEALASIEGAYTTVRGYDPATGRWLIYTAGAPDYANTLTDLEYGKGYEIRATRDVLLLLRGSEEGAITTAVRALAQPQPFPPAPATYYGVVQGGATFRPTAGHSVTAFVDGQVCGRGDTLLDGGQVVYRIDVAADGWAAPGCGAPGRAITFEIVGHAALLPTPWNNDGAHELNLGVP